MFDFTPETVDHLMDFDILIFENDQPDVQVVTLRHDYEITCWVGEHFGDHQFQTIVFNNDPETKSLCPYFRIISSGVADNTPTNHKFKNFLSKIKVEHIVPKVHKVVVMGLHTLMDLSSPISMPSSFYTTSIDFLDLEKIASEIDMSCLAPCGAHDHTITSICDIAGMYLPYYVPPEVQWKILTYLQSPTAMLIENKMDEICTNWDKNLFAMFQQREPRIPSHIASYFSAATVRSAIELATSPFLVQRVPTSALNANLRTRSL
jgi:hypothetical protein